MPNALASDITALAHNKKANFILSCLGGGFVTEWIIIYESVARFVHNMYQYRALKYKEFL